MIIKFKGNENYVNQKEGWRRKRVTMRKKERSTERVQVRKKKKEGKAEDKERQRQKIRRAR